MCDKQKKILLEALPLLSKITGGYSTLTDSKGVMITNYNYEGKEINEFKGQVYNMALRCIKEKRPLMGPAHYDPNSKAWAVPIGDYVLASTDTQRIRNEENLKASIIKALPLIARVIGGQAIICDKTGSYVFGCNSNGEPMNVLKSSERAKQTIETMEPIVIMSKKIEGVHVVYIPITADCCLILNNEAATIKSMKLMEEVKKLQRTKYNFSDIIGQSDAIKQTISNAERTAYSNSTVVLVGETGTGKEVFAQGIHNASHREGKPFIAINCAAIPASLMESNLFGYEEGAFTGAKKGGMPGSFEQADGGTIFLDEISEMDFNLQSKLLRVIQEREVTRIGSNTSIPVNFRIISATNKNLFELVKEKRFREDLYYRLHVIRINIPPLRHREGDIPLLADHFIKKYNYQIGKSIRRIEKDALSALEKYSWPGNVRELENSIEYAVNMVDYTDDTIQLFHLPQHISLHTSSLKRTKNIRFNDNNWTLEDYVQEYEKEIIMQIMDKSKQKTSVAAKSLGISVSTLWRKMQRYGLL